MKQVINKRDNKLLVAVQRNDLVEAEKLLNGTFGFNKANPNTMDESGLGSLHYALSEEMVDLLCKYKANPNLHGDFYDRGDRRPLHTAANAAVTKALRKHGANIREVYKDSLNTPLHCAKTADQVDAVLEEDGIELLNQRNRYGDTALDVIKDDEAKMRLRERGGKTSDELGQEQQIAVKDKKLTELSTGLGKKSLEI